MLYRYIDKLWYNTNFCRQLWDSWPSENVMCCLILSLLNSAPQHDTGAAMDIFSWRIKVEDGNLPLCWWGLQGGDFGRQGTSHRCKLLVPPGTQALSAGTDKKWQDIMFLVLCTHTAALSSTQYTGVVGNICLCYFYMSKVKEHFCWSQSKIPRNLLGSQTGLHHVWVPQNSWNLIQEKVPLVQGCWKLQPGDEARQVTPCSTVTFNPTVLPLWLCW